MPAGTKHLQAVARTASIRPRGKPVNAHTERGHICADVAEFDQLLVNWLADTSEPTIGKGDGPHLMVTIGGVPCGLTSDTTRAGVRAYLSALVAGCTGYSVVAGQTGAVRRIATGASRTPIPGFYLYSNDPLDRPRVLTGSAADRLAFGPEQVALLILDAVAVLHSRGNQQVRILPGMSASGADWRVAVTAASNLRTGDWTDPHDPDSVFHYSTAAGREVAGDILDRESSAEDVADIVLSALPVVDNSRDWPHTGWYVETLGLVRRHNGLPVAYADYFDDAPGWEIGWGSGVRIEGPPSWPETAARYPPS